MKLIDEITRETLVICNDSDKKLILMRNKLVNVKVMTFIEFMKQYYFDYDEDTIMYVMNKYNLKYSVALMYVKNLYYVLDKEYSVRKLDFLVNLKKELDSKSLLKYNKYFLEYLNSVDVIVYGIRLTKFELRTLSDVNYKYINKDRNNYQHDVYSFDTEESEVEYVAHQICSLIDNGVSVSNIKLTNVDSSYYNSLNRIFTLFGLRVNINNKISLASFTYVKDFINSYNEGNLIDSVNNLDDSNPLYNELMKVINSYIKYDNKELIVYKLENTYVNSPVYDNAIEIVNYLEYTNNDMDYVFMLGFNDGIIPSSYKDNEYITDNIRGYVDMSLCSEMNRYLHEDIINNIRDIKNLCITYKLRDIKKTYYPSSLCSSFNVVKPVIDNSVGYSEVYNKIKLAKRMDDYIKYGYQSEDMGILYKNFKIKYNSYDNSYKLINRVMDKLNLSYSKMQTYNKCAFRYYLSDILKLDIYEENFAAIIGSMVHYVLEKCLSNNDNDVLKYADEFLLDMEFSNKEKFFLEKYKDSIFDILKQIDLERSFSSFDNAMYEKKIEIHYDDNVKFSGIIDKILYKEDCDKTYVSLIDYKTGNDDISLKYINYGLNMQLPIYLYLSNYLNLRNIVYSGFYLQKLNITDCDYRLQGYSNSDRNILSVMDNNYENSKIIKGLKTNKDGAFYNYSKVLSNADIDRIKEITESKIQEVITNIKNNRFDINPKSCFGDNMGCMYCKYSDICFVKKKDMVDISNNLVGSDLDGLY